MKQLLIITSFVMAFVIAGCATDGVKPLSYSQTFKKLTIDGKSIYVGQSKSVLESTLGPPDDVGVFDPRNTVAGMIFEGDLKAHGYWRQAVSWFYKRDGKTYRILFDEGNQYVSEIAEVKQN